MAVRGHSECHIGGQEGSHISQHPLLTQGLEVAYRGSWSGLGERITHFSRHKPTRRPARSSVQLLQLVPELGEDGPCEGEDGRHYGN